MTKLYDDSTSVSIGSFSVYNLLGLGPGPDYQSFTTGSSAVTLTSLAFDLSDNANFDGNFVSIALYSNSGTSAGASLSTLGTIADSSLSSTAAFVTLTTSSSYTLAANTTYWIGLSNNMTGGGAIWYYTSTASANANGTGTTSQALENHTTVDANDQFLMTVNATSLCFAEGSRVLTSKGEVPVEQLRQGDLVMGLRGGKFRQVKWVGQRDVDLRAHPYPDTINPVRVCADAFGPGQPHRDLVLSPNHALYVDGQLIAVQYLVNGATIRQEQWENIKYFHVELEAHDVMLVDGLAAESFLDIGNRGAFSNGGGPVMLHPDFARQTWEAEACAPDMPKDEALTQLRQSLIARAPAIGHRLTEDADLCVLAGKRRLRPIEVPEGYRFTLPKGAHTVRLESRVFKPCEIRPDRTDARVLGIGVKAIWLDDRPIPLDDPRLTTGWHAPEPGLRWTKGEASLRSDGARTLTLCLFLGQYYWVAADALEDAHVAA